MAQAITITLELDNIKTSARTEIWKWGQVNKDDANYQRIYHLQHSENDNVDRNLLNLYLKQRAERIADIVSEYLTDIVFGSVVVPIGPNNPEPSPFLPPQRSTEPNRVVYELTLPGGWNPKTYQTLVRHFEDYVLNGAVADWFANVGIDQGVVYERKVADTTGNIIKNIYHKNPMQ